jgi:ribosome production factor 2
MPKKTGPSSRAIRAMKKKEPTLVEPERRLLALRGPSSSEIGVSALRDLVSARVRARVLCVHHRRHSHRCTRKQVVLKKPDAKLLTRKNDILPFEEASSLEYLCEKNECSAFLYTSHNKKRPHNLVLGRTFDGRILDMIELGLDPATCLGSSDFAGPKKLLGSKPMLLFQGDEWERHPTLVKLKSLLTDAFGMKGATKLALTALDHVIAITAMPSGAGSVADASGLVSGAWQGTVAWRVYTVILKRSGSMTPAVELVPHGPAYDWTVRRTFFASPELDKEAHRKPAQLKKKKVKNVTHDEFGETLGRLHMERQDFAKLELKKTKGGKADKRARTAEGATAAGGEEDEEMDGGAEEEEEEAPVARPKSFKSNNLPLKNAKKRARGQ